MFKIDDPINNYKNIAHAFFISLAISIAEPSTIMPLMVHHFTQSAVIIGVFASLLRGGAIVIQLYASFHAQTYKRVIPYLRKAFLFRVLSWFSIGLAIYLIGDKNRELTLFFIGLGLFFFSFIAGFGAIYFKELQAKLFSRACRGKIMANRNIASSVASIISGGVAGFVLKIYPPPLSYAYLFMVSSAIMAIGFAIFSTIDEPSKENVSKKEKSFKEFIKNSNILLKKDRRLKIQILALFLSYGYLLAMPFVILKAKSSFELSGWLVGGFISIQMIGSIVGSSLLWRRISNYEKMLSISFIIAIAAYVAAILSNSLYVYFALFLLFGVAKDGFSIAAMNLVIEIAPEDKRPIYTALQTNLSSIGLFFPVLGGYLLKIFDSYNFVYILSIAILTAGLIISLRIKGTSNNR